MDNYKFTSKDFSLLKELLKVTKNIKLIYNELCDLEIKNEKNSQKYNELLNTLKQNISIENNLYEAIGTDIKRLYSYVEYLFPNGGSTYEEEIEMLKNNDENNILRERASCKISELISTYSFEDEELLMDDTEDEELLEIDEELLEIDEELLSDDDEYKKEALIELSVQEDISNTILVMIDKYIKNEKYSFMKDKIIKLKYNFLFMYKNIESIALKNNLNINSDLYLKSIFLTDIFKKDKKNTFNTMDSYINNLYKIEFQELIYLIRDVEDKKLRKEKLVLTTLLLRTFIIFMSNAEVKNIKNTIDLELLLNMYDMELIESLISEVFNESIKDKKIPKILSLRP